LPNNGNVFENILKYLYVRVKKGKSVACKLFDDKEVTGYL